MAANFLKANNHRQGKIFFQKQIPATAIYLTVNCFLSGPTPLIVKLFQ